MNIDLTSPVKKNMDHISFRVDFIKELLGSGKLEPLIDMDTCETEKLITHVHENNANCDDAQCILNKKILNFNKMITQIGGKLVYIKSGTTGHTFKGTIDDKNNNVINYAVKICAYSTKENYGDVNDIKRPENAELLMLRVLSYFVLNNHTPHIVLPIGTFNTNIKPFLNLTKNKIINDPRYEEFVDKYKKGLYHDDVSILISEWANGGDLGDYIKNNYKSWKTKHWRVLFFQIISVLAVIHYKYPSFRHNDLKANNILVQEIKIKDKEALFKYKINGREYLVPNVGFQIKLWDFDFACIPGVVNNAKVNAAWTNKLNVKPTKNRYYDLHYFFNTLTKKGFFPQFWETSYVDKKVKNFVKRIIPDELSEGDAVRKSRFLLNIEHTTPDKILKNDPFFNKMRPETDRTKINE